MDTRILENKTEELSSPSYMYNKSEESVRTSLLACLLTTLSTH